MQPINPVQCRVFNESGANPGSPTFPYKEDVGGSSPSTPTNSARRCSLSEFLCPSQACWAIIDLRVSFFPRQGRGRRFEPLTGRWPKSRTGFGSTVPSRTSHAGRRRRRGGRSLGPSDRSNTSVSHLGAESLLASRARTSPTSWVLGRPEPRQACDKDPTSPVRQARSTVKAIGKEQQ